MKFMALPFLEKLLHKRSHYYEGKFKLCKFLRKDINKMERTRFDNFLEKSDKLREGYKKSLGKKDSLWKEKFLKEFSDIPQMFIDIYDKCNGTNSQIKNQVLFDFLPGYRLMEVGEILSEYREIIQYYNVIDEEMLIIPFLKDYASSYIAYMRNKKNECIVLISEEEGIVIKHDSVGKFWETIIAFYDEEVYFLDDDGYLSYDFDAEEVVGKRINSNIDYWK